MGGESVVHGTVDIQDLKRACREKGVSVTKYLTASLIWSICQVYMGGTPGTQSVSYTHLDVYKRQGHWACRADTG